MKPVHITYFVAARDGLRYERFHKYGTHRERLQDRSGGAERPDPISTPQPRMTSLVSEAFFLFPEPYLSKLARLPRSPAPSFRSKSLTLSCVFAILAMMTELANPRVLNRDLVTLSSCPSSSQHCDLLEWDGCIGRSISFGSLFMLSAITLSFSESPAEPGLEDREILTIAGTVPCESCQT
jgi:hypothetical protein